jgi:hypothetical protein
VLHSMACCALSSENVVAMTVISLHQSAIRIHGHSRGLLIASPKVLMQRATSAIPFGETTRDCPDCSARTVNLKDHLIKRHVLNYNYYIGTSDATTIRKSSYYMLNLIFEYSM